MATKFEVLSASGGSARILKVTGEVDMETAPALKEQIQKALKGVTVLKIDLKNVTYVDSSGIAILIGGHRDAKKSKTDYRLLDPSPQVKAVIELAMLQQFFTIEMSGGDA